MIEILGWSVLAFGLGLLAAGPLEQVQAMIQNKLKTRRIHKTIKQLAREANATLILYEEEQLKRSQVSQPTTGGQDGHD